MTGELACVYAKSRHCDDSVPVSHSYFQASTLTGAANCWMADLPTRSVAESLGFPSGYFSIRSIANAKYWDIHGNFDTDGTIVYLWKEKEHSLVAGGILAKLVE